MNKFFTQSLNLSPRSNSLLNMPNDVQPGENTTGTGVWELAGPNTVRASGAVMLSLSSLSISCNELNGPKYLTCRAESRNVSLSVPVPASR